MSHSTAFLLCRYCHGVKTRSCQTGRTLPRLNESQISRWAKQYPTHNCAAVAFNGKCWFFEIDDPTLPGGIEKATGHSLEEIDTLVVKSSGAKRHYYFKHDARSEAMGNVSADDAKVGKYSLPVFITSMWLPLAAFILTLGCRMKSCVNRHSVRFLLPRRGSLIGLTRIQNYQNHQVTPKRFPRLFPRVPATRLSRR